MAPPPARFETSDLVQDATLDLSAEVTDIAVGDLDLSGDSIQHALTTRNGSTCVMGHFGVWSTAANLSDHVGADQVAIADMDLDGDLAVIGPAGQFRIDHNDASGGFPATADVVGGVDTTVHELLVDELSGTGCPAIITATDNG